MSLSLHVIHVVFRRMRQPVVCVWHGVILIQARSSHCVGWTCFLAMPLARVGHAGVMIQLLCVGVYPV
jgi:hypothetical protein